MIKVPFEDWWRTFEQRAFPGVDATFIHAFDDPDVMAGNGTIGLEILEDLADVDAIVIPWGGGGLACGIASVVKALRPSTRIYAAEIETAAPLSASLAAGCPRTVEYRPSFVDGIGSKMVFPGMFEEARRLLDGSLVVTLAEAGAAIRLVAERSRVICEGAAACAVAAALSGRAGSGKVVAIVSGGNSASLPVRVGQAVVPASRLSSRLFSGPGRQAGRKAGSQPRLAAPPKYLPGPANRAKVLQSKG